MHLQFLWHTAVVFWDVTKETSRSPNVHYKTNEYMYVVLKKKTLN